MLEGGGIFEHSVRMHARFVRKCAHAHIRLVFGDRRVRRVCDRHGALVNICEFFGRNALVSALQLQVADDGGKIRIAAPLAEAEKRALDLPRARFYRFYGVGNGEPAVVVAVDRHDRIGEAVRHRFGDGVRLVGEYAAVRVAKAQAVRARFVRLFKRLHRIGGVRFVAVEKVLRVEYDLFAVFAEEFHAFVDHGEIFLRRGFDHISHVHDVALAENSYVFGTCGQERSQVAVFLGSDPFAARGAECDDLGVFQLHARYFLEKLHFRGVGKGVARFDKVYAQPVERFDDLYFVVYRKGDVCPLRTVAQGRIEYL